MDHILYDHQIKPKYSLASDRYSHYYIMRFCTQCYTRSWGIWHTCENEYQYFFSRFEETHKNAKLVAERDDVCAMNKCPICGGGLKSEHLYLFGYFHETLYGDSKRYYLSKIGATLIESSGQYPVAEIEKLNPSWRSAKGVDPETIVGPDGIGIGFREYDTWENKKYVNIQYYHCDHPDDFKSICAFINRNMRPIVTKKGEERLTRLISKCENIESTDVRYNVKDVEQLKAYLGSLVEIEKNIYAISERLKSLYSEEYVSGKELFSASEFSLKKVISSAEKAERDLKKLQSENPTEGVTIKQIKVSLPNAPVAPTKPQPPILEKPGFFNKKRILAENAIRTETYEKQCAAYDELSQEYQKKLAMYTENVRLLKEDQQRKYQELLQNLEQQHQELLRQQEEKCQRAKEAVKAAKMAQSTTQTPKAVGLQSVKEEIRQAEDLFQKLYAARREMYLSGVVFPKYHNFVAISSFYEYICSGRCESLDGVNGAYNIYENEVRMNAVISQLSQVIAQLEAIKQNQYVLYSAISDTNRQLSDLNDSMQTMNTSLAKMDQTLTNVAKNTEVIAYNSAVTAYYTKKNTELTNALGYLIALT